MEKLTTSILLKVCLLVGLLMFSCSKETSVIEEVEAIETTSRPLTAIFNDAQSTMLQIFSSIVVESINGSIPIAENTGTCPLVDTDVRNCGGVQGTELVLKYNNCMDANGHTLNGEITISACVDNLLNTTPQSLGCISLHNNAIAINDFNFEIINANKIYFYFDLGSDPKFVFLAEPWLEFRCENDGDKTDMMPALGEDGAFMEFRLAEDPLGNFNLDFTTLYNSEYYVRFLENDTDDPKWKVKVCPSGGGLQEFRAITSEDLLFTPSYGYPYDGNVLCCFNSGSGYIPGEDWDFGSDGNGCTTGTPIQDSYVEICQPSNPNDCIIALGCSVWDMAN